MTINDKHKEQWKKNIEKQGLEWAFKLLKHYNIIPEDTILEIKERAQWVII